MSNKGISEIPLYDPNLPKMDCSLFEVTTVMKKNDFDIRFKILLYNVVHRSRKKSVN